MSALTTHVLDTSRGRPAAGMNIEVWSVEPSKQLKTVTTNSDGRVDAPLLSGAHFGAGFLDFTVEDEHAPDRVRRRGEALQILQLEGLEASFGFP